jgi:predicted DNA-binding transcriptional regulator AlpA
MQRDALLRRFDEWEARTRQCPSWPERADLEPSFEPLFAERRVRAGIVDDSRAPGILDRVFGKRAEKPANEAKSQEPIAIPRKDRGELTELQLLLPEGFAIKAGMASRVLSSLRNVEYPLSFELVGTASAVVVQVCCAVIDRAAVLASFRAYFPELKTRERSGYLRAEWEGEERFAAILGFGLRERVFRQLATEDKLDLDPLIGIVSSLGNLSEGELGFVQVLFQPARQPWGAEFEDFASKIVDVDKVLPHIRDKFAEPVYAVSIRVGALGPDEEGALNRACDIAGAVHAATRSETNELELLPASDPSFEDEANDVVDRETHRSGMLLSLRELLTLVHPPSAMVRSERLVRQGGRTKTAPLATVGHDLILGVNEHDGEERTVSLSTSERLRHSYIIGASGTGKSTLLLSMAIQDIEAGNGFAVLDPHGDLIDDILSRIPPSRVKDVILFDPGDEAFPIGFNILSAHSELEKTLLSSDLVAVFRRLSTSFGDQMVTVLGNAILAFLESCDGGTLLDLRHFFVDKAFRARFLDTVQDPEVVHYWEREFPLLKGSPQAPLLTRLNTFLRPKLIRHMVAQKEDRLDLRAIMDGKKILLARLSHGAIGEENAHLLGSLLVAKIAQAAMSRQDEEAVRRVPFFLYIDEFHHFVTPSISSILSGARKYGLGLVLAHQEMRQLKSRSEEVMSAVLGNVYTRIVFRLGDQDARTLADGLSFFEASDLQNLGIGEAIARVERPDFDFNLRTRRVEAVDERFASERRRAVTNASRAAYGTPRAEVEARLQADRAERQPSGQAAPKASQPRSAASVEEPIAPAQKTNAPLPGRGGPQHKYLQSLVKRLAEDRGFAVSLEKTVLDGHGYVDVALEREGLSVACEISVTTRVAHELGNLTKCLAAGFDHAVLLSSDERTLRSARTQISDADIDRIRLLNPDELIAFLDELIGVPKPAPPLIPRRMGNQGRVSMSAPSALDAGKRMLGTIDAAAYVGLAVQTLAKMRVSGESPPFYKLGRQVLYDRAELDEWVTTRKRRSTSDTGKRN